MGKGRQVIKSTHILVLTIVFVGCLTTHLNQIEDKAQMITIPVSIKNFFQNKPASIELIAKVENELQLRFPPQLREFYLLHNGFGYHPFVEKLDDGSIEPSGYLEFSYSKHAHDHDPKNKDNARYLESIASCYDTDPSVDFLPVMSIQERRVYDEVPPWMLIFGLCDTAEPGQLCISLREEDYGTIYYYDVGTHWEMTEEDFEEDPLMPLWFVSPSLQQFLDNLRIS